MQSAKNDHQSAGFICVRTNSPHLQNTLSARTIQPDDIPVGDISTKLVGHAAVLFRFDEISGEILFKNACCDEWDCGDMFRYLL